ncbi:hypothetical protein [Qipengyuania sp. ASV99]|uniref:hypothetical protein n=1 Tax=Qipengyuania sp. ASV99 TaxID=3399681 RepID=UPI003A4C73D8
MNDGFGKGRVGAAIGGEPVGTGWRTFFWTACLFNFVIGALGMFSPEATVDARIIGLLVLCFGIIYFLVARDPARFGSTLWAGVVGKIGVVALLGPSAIGPGGDPIVAAVLAGDALFAIGFLAFLLTRADVGP